MEDLAMNKRVILIMTDTTRKDMLGCYGNAEMITPNLDKLASEGIKYENAYTCQPVCGPARSALFTGTFPHSNGMVTNSVPLGANVKTVGQRLSDNDIPCGYIGKWHLDGGDYFGFGICPDGWDENYWYDMKMYLDELTDEDKVRSRQCVVNNLLGFIVLVARTVCYLILVHVSPLPLEPLAPNPFIKRSSCEEQSSIFLYITQAKIATEDWGG